MIKKYNKLVRDRIPEIIFKEGKEFQSKIKILSKEEFFKELKKKVLEEADELFEAINKEEIIKEMIDVQELIDTLLEEIGLTIAQFRKLQEQRREERGGFKKRIFLISTNRAPML